MLHVISLIAFSVVVVLYALTGALALTTGRLIMPRWRGQVLRPRLWGSGALLFVVGIVLFRFAPTVSGTTLDVLSACGLVLLVSGAVLQLLGRSAGRVRV
ncbi:hypothetical protein [Streptomyces sp. NPDC093261]|uniref:hypothetical protein n=1 Tax=Streptomyces sp. NPDC093261 TaxID=3366037 RepID=UPI0037F65A0F